MDSLQLFLELVPAMLVTLAVSHLAAQMFAWMGQPRVIGEIVAGLLLGPSIFGALSPHIFHRLFNPDVKVLLFQFSNLGLVLYMFLIGTTLEHANLTKKGVQRSSVLAVAGILPSFVLGMGVGWLLYDQFSLSSVSKAAFMIFIGCSLCITAFPVLARILEERGINNSALGSLTLVAASIDDAIAWCFLAFFTAFSQSRSSMSVLLAIGEMILFVVVMQLVVKRYWKRVGERVEQRGKLNQMEFCLVLLVLLAACWFTEYIGISALFGGFITGLCLPKSPVFRREIQKRLSDVVSVLLLPIFFTYSGLNTNLNGVFTLAGAGALLLITACSILGKYGGSYLVVCSMGFSKREASAVGGLMNARGLMELSLLNIGLTYGIISQSLFSILVFMALITTSIVLPIYSLSLPEQKLLAQRNTT